MFELANVRIIESCHKNSSNPSEWKKNTKMPFCIFFKLFKMRAWSISTGYIVGGGRLHAFFYILILHYSVTIKFEKSTRTCLLVDQRKNSNRISKRSSSDDYMLGQDLALLKNQ